MSIFKIYPSWAVFLFLTGCHSGLLTEEELLRWKLDSLGCNNNRLAIAQELVEQKKLIGLKRNEVIELLGPSELESGSSLVYFIGRSWQCDSVPFSQEQIDQMKLLDEPGDRLGLVVNFDNGDYASNAHIPKP